MSRFLVSVALGLSVMSLEGCGNESSQSGAGKVESGTSSQAATARENQAPDFTLASLDGRTVRLSDYQGRVILVDFWATWCGPCRRTIPDLIELYKEHNPGGLDILGIALERRGTERLIPYVQENQIPYPVLIGTSEVVQSFGSFQSIPTAFLIGRDGTVRQKFVGVQPRSVLEKAILDLLAEPSPV